ncbi:hypothetical protein lerEdw1_010608 [Lerista edwardsae]|nr:hypothetical protein lerEdw1_010608 [Lerista edwardsae]
METWGVGDTTDDKMVVGCSDMLAFDLQAEALHEVFEKLRNKHLSAEKKSGWVPSCDAGEHCAVRKGARIGKLCNCPRGTSCNLYILKCL